MSVCDALGQWENWTDDQRAGYLSDLINDQLNEWGCDPINGVTFNPSLHKGLYDPNTGTINIDASCKQFLQSGGGQEKAQQCSVTALHEAGHALADCVGAQLPLPVEQLLVEALAWMNYWDAAKLCANPPSESSVMYRMWQNLKFLYENPEG